MRRNLLILLSNGFFAVYTAYQAIFRHASRHRPNHLPNCCPDAAIGRVVLPTNLIVFAKRERDSITNLICASRLQFRALVWYRFPLAPDASCRRPHNAVLWMHLFELEFNMPQFRRLFFEIDLTFSISAKCFFAGGRFCLRNIHKGFAFALSSIGFAKAVLVRDSGLSRKLSKFAFNSRRISSTRTKFFMGIVNAILGFATAFFIARDARGSLKKHTQFFRARFNNTRNHPRPIIA